MTQEAIIQALEVGPMQNLIYFVGDFNLREVFVVDPAWEIDTIFRKAAEQNFKIVGAIITHYHYDHTNGIEEMLERQAMPVYLHRQDLDYVKVPASVFTLIDHGHRLRAGNIEIECLHTPGHTPGSQCLKIKNHVITGDTLFVGGCGRCDLPGGDAETLYYTLTQKIMRMPENTVFYPGHDYGSTLTSTIGQEKRENVYLRLAAQSLKDFLNLRTKR